MTALRFDPVRLPPHCQSLRQEVRAFLAEEIAAGTFDPRSPESGSANADAFTAVSANAAGSA